MRKPMLMALTVALILVAIPRVAFADETCTGAIGAVTIDDNLTVPDDATCTLEGTVVEGNIQLESQTTLRATGITVGGNVQTIDGEAIEVSIHDSDIDGDVQVFDSSIATVSNTRVGGNIQYDGNAGDLAVLASDVDGDVQLFDNDGGDKEVSDNTIGGNLQCKDNDPAPWGSNNIVEGNSEDQCADLEGTPPPDGTRFEDVPPDHTFYDDIEALAESGVTLGCNPPENSRFCPQEGVLRQEMAAFLVRALDLAAGTASFDDVNSNNTFAADIAALADAGITKGCNPPDNNLFCPGDTVARAEMAAFLVRALDLAPGTASFDDVDSNNTFAADIAALADAGITKGCNPPDNNLFCPDDPVTRAQMAAFLVRAGLTD
jgi:hypothetical protein